MESLIEELTKVNPSNLSEEGLKLFNKINEIIDRNRELEEDLHDDKEYIRELHHKLTNAIEIKYIHEDYILKSKVRELREIDNVDLLQFKIKELLQEGDK